MRLCKVACRWPGAAARLAGAQRDLHQLRPHRLDERAQELCKLLLVHLRGAQQSRVSLRRSDL